MKPSNRRQLAVGTPLGVGAGIFFLYGGLDLLARVTLDSKESYIFMAGADFGMLGAGVELFRRTSKPSGADVAENSDEQEWDDEWFRLSTREVLVLGIAVFGFFIFVIIQDLQIGPFDPGIDVAASTDRVWRDCGIVLMGGASRKS